MTSNEWPCFEATPAGGAAASGSPSLRCTSGRIAHVWMRNCAHAGTALSQAPAYGCDTATSRTATSRTLRRMEADGLITRADGKTDGRTRTIALTPRGAELLSRAIPLAKRNAAVIAARLNPAEQAQLMSLLQKISTGDDTPPPNR